MGEVTTLPQKTLVDEKVTSISYGPTIRLLVHPPSLTDTELNASEKCVDMCLITSRWLFKESKPNFF